MAYPLFDPTAILSAFAEDKSALKHVLLRSNTMLTARFRVHASAPRLIESMSGNPANGEWGFAIWDNFDGDRRRNGRHNHARRLAHLSPALLSDRIA
jgi:hypothetical protein